jgi:hypothetical protein
LKERWVLSSLLGFISCAKAKKSRRKRREGDREKGKKRGCNPSSLASFSALLIGMHAEPHTPDDKSIHLEGKAVWRQGFLLLKRDGRLQFFAIERRRERASERALFFFWVAKSERQTSRISSIASHHATHPAASGRSLALPRPGGGSLTNVSSSEVSC